VSAASITAIWWWLRCRYVVVTVDGTSMEPAYRPGDRLLVRRTSAEKLRRGDVVVVTASPTSPTFGAVGDRRWVVKRIAGLPGQVVPPEVARSVPQAIVPPGQLILLGDNAANSIDSRTAGCYAGDRVLGIVQRRLGR
jgi:signal peptidase I